MARKRKLATVAFHHTAPLAGSIERTAGPRLVRPAAAWALPDGWPADPETAVTTTTLFETPPPSVIIVNR